MPITSSHTRFAGLTTNFLAIALLALPIPTHAALEQSLQNTTSQTAPQHSNSVMCLQKNDINKV